MKCYDSMSNDIGDKKHYIFHCTNPKLVEIRKTFTPGIYETITPYPDVNSINDILHIILRGSRHLMRITTELGNFYHQC